jgi:hypothetical protein
MLMERGHAFRHLCVLQADFFREESPKMQNGRRRASEAVGSVMRDAGTATEEERMSPLASDRLESMRRRGRKQTGKEATYSWIQAR